MMLVVLVLLLGLGSSLLALVGSHRKVVRSATAREECRLWRSTIEALLREQIRAATTQPGHGWTSQPGLLRTFDANGRAGPAFKLYSSRHMQVPGAGLDLTELATEDAPVDWADRPAVFVDLNTDRRGHWPIVDPAAAGAVDGFSYDSRWGVAMPVTWLYLLQNGDLAAPLPVEGKPGRVRLPGATKKNPIVARLAFWSDDETCRVNLNTAVGGAFWEPPLTTTVEDADMAWSQPLDLEFSRFPGHPARVDLGTVFPEALAAQTPRYGTLLALAPGYQEGGSQEGTRNTLGRGVRGMASLNRFLWHRESDWGLAAAQLPSRSRLAPAFLDQRRFFVTTSAPSSDLNLFGKPRVNLWPIPADQSQRSPRDLRAHLVSSLPTALPATLAFHRSDPDSTTTDAALAENVAVLNYLRRMTQGNPPGFRGGSLEGKFGVAGREFVLAGVLDTVRGINSTSRLTQTHSYTGQRVDGRSAGQGQILPSEWTHGSVAVRGHGRVPTLAEVALHFYPSERNASGQTTKLTAVLLLELQFSQQGYPALLPNIQMEVAASATPGSTTPGVNGQPLDFAGSTALPAAVAAGHSPWPAGERMEGGLLTWRTPLFGKTPGNGDPARHYPFVKEDLAVSGGHFVFSGGEYVVTLKAPDAAGDWQPYQTLTVAFPSPANAGQLWPVPAWAGGGANTKSFSARYGGARESPGFFGADTVRSVEYAGDPRLLITRGQVPGGAFVPGNRTSYDDATQAHASSLMASPGQLYDGAVAGELLAGLNATAGMPVPNLPASISGVAGDWSNGMGNLPDGAWTYKSDEGFRAGRGLTPYQDTSQGLAAAIHDFPQRELPSAAVLGSLNRGATSDWETLLFCPNPVAGAAHPGQADPPDHLWLDLFRHPATEPFPLADVASAQGRVNLNTELVPFPHLTRTTALRAVLKSVRLGAMAPSLAGRYKQPGSTSDVRFAVDVDATINRLQQRFFRQDVYRSETEICAEFLVPDAPGAATDPQIWWAGYGLTGDNMRERPYAHLLPLLTTRSHAFRTFYRIERLRQPPGQSPDLWTEGVGRVEARLWGSFRLVRWLDSEDSRLSGRDLADQSLEPYLRIRVEELGED